MILWLNSSSAGKQNYLELRLNALKGERILLDFNPLKTSDIPNWEAKWKDWHCYNNPLRVYFQDYEFLLSYFKGIYPFVDASNGSLRQELDVCFDNWIEKNDWLKIINEIENNLEHISDSERKFLSDFIEWLKEALKHTTIIVVEGNL